MIYFQTWSLAVLGLSGAIASVFALRDSDDLLDFIAILAGGLIMLGTGIFFGILAVGLLLEPL